MPPKKPPPGQSTQSLAQPPATAYERKPQPLPIVPDAASIPPLWTPPSAPKELFPEWPSAASLATEDWGNDDAPYDDPTPPVGFLATTATVEWKRPCEFLPPIAEPALPAVPVSTDVKPTATGKKGAAPPVKKGEPPEPPKKPKAPKFAHIVHVPTETDHSHHNATSGTTALPAPDTKKTAGASTAAAIASHPATPAVVTPPQPPPRRILHDFRRVWSPEQVEELTWWRREEERITREKERRERVYMEFEDAIAFIINGRARTLNEDDVKAEDLEDDGDDQAEQDNDGLTSDSSPFGGFLPPSTIEIAGNAVMRPEIPHGDVVQPAFASYLRIVDQLHQQWSASPLGSEVGNTQYLWEAIHPQDAQRVPIYNHAGKYSVRLFIAGKWRRVDVDDKLPIDKEGNIQIVSSSKRNELWPSILAKAIIKVANWFDIEEEIHFAESSGSSAASSIRLASLVVSSLTSWKVTQHDSTAVFAGNYQSLQEYIPEGYQSDSQNEMCLDGTDDNEPEMPEHAPIESPNPNQALTSRVVVNWVAARGSQKLVYQEASLLVGIVGDPGSVSLKIVDLNGPSSIKEEELSAGVVSFLAIHPPMRYADLLFESWSVDANGVADPFKNPPAQFCVISSMTKAAAQPPGDASSEAIVPENSLVNVVVTLCPFPPRSSRSHEDGSKGQSEIAKHLGVDPRGSVLLVEDLDLENYCSRLSSQNRPKRRPMVFKIDSTSSTLLQLPRGEFETMAFRVYPQSMCRYGYSLVVESDVKVEWQISSTYWRNIWDLQVIEGDGTYQAMLPGSWNILFKQTIELARPAEDASNCQGVISELQVDLQLSDVDLAPSTHLYLVNQDGDQVISLSGIHGGVVLPDEATSYTLIVECRPKKLTPEGKWHLTLGSNHLFKRATILQPRLTIFSGMYVPNKPLISFRDVIQNPKKTTSTSLQFELLDSDMRAISDLAATMQVVDLSSGQPLMELSRLGVACVLQLPPYTKTPDDPNESKSGYIIQCGIDKMKCHVPTWIQSVRPFSNKQSDSPKTPPIDECEEVRDHVTPQLNWRLQCWSVDEVKLEFDRTLELHFDAIRADWAEAAKDRDAHGVSSRLLFLGNYEAAASAMAEDSLSDDQITKYKACAQWLHEARQQVAGLSEHDHIKLQPEVSPDVEILREPEELAHDHELLQARMNEMSIFLQSIRDDRAKETRGDALKHQIQMFIDQRKEAETHRQTLHFQRDEVRAQLDVSSG